MTKHLLAIALIAASASAAAQPVGYPGVTWNSIVIAPKKITQDRPTVQLQGIVEQGVDWFRFGAGDRWKFNTYVAATYVLSDQGSGNMIAPQIGAKATRRYDNGSLDLGIRAVSEHRSDSTVQDPSIVSVRSTPGVQLYATFWFDWNLKK